LMPMDATGRAPRSPALPHADGGDGGKGGRRATASDGTPGDPGARYPLNRGLARGLAILQALNRLRDASSLQLAAATGIPRPTVHRILESLRALGYVDRARMRDAYRLTSLVHTLSEGHSSSDWITESAAPVLQELLGRFVWPGCVATFEDGAMVVRANTHLESPLSLGAVPRGTRFPMRTTSIGRAYLAFCPDAERQWILELLARTTVPAAQRARWKRSTEKLLEGVRQCGYGLREGRPGSRTASLAVPIHADGRVLACLGIVWIHSALRTGDAIARFAGPMTEAAERIAAHYRLQRFDQAVAVSGTAPMIDVARI